MASMMSSQGGVVLAACTAMAAVSGTVILLAFRLQKPHFTPPFPSNSILRPCLSSGERKVGGEKKKKKKKRVRFAADVVDQAGDSVEFRRLHGSGLGRCRPSAAAQTTGMPANRVALYNGILRDRVTHRLACTY